MLPGDYVAYRLTNDINTTITGLSEGIFWDFKNQSTANFLLDYYGISEDKLPDIVSNFQPNGQVTAKLPKNLDYQKAFQSLTGQETNQTTLCH